MSDTSTVPGSAACCSRAARFTVAPKIRPWSEASEPIATGPVWIPTRTWSGSGSPTSCPRRPTRSIRVRPARTARSASSSCVCLHPEDADDRVTGEVVGAASERLELLRDRPVVTREDLAVPLRIDLRGELRGPDEVDEDDRDDLALLRERRADRIPTVRAEAGLVGQWETASFAGQGGHGGSVRGVADGPAGQSLATRKPSMSRIEPVRSACGRSATSTRWPTSSGSSP